MGSDLDKLDDLDDLDDLDSVLLVNGRVTVCIWVVPLISPTLPWVTTPHHPTDEIRIAQTELQRVTIWKNVCLFFVRVDVNRFEGVSCVIRWIYSM
jgi:hypothetical protein